MGATPLMTNNASNLLFISSYIGLNKVIIGDSNALFISHTSSTSLETSRVNMKLKNVLVVSSITKNIL